MESPKLFISYSWSNATHEQWVVSLATELRESGVDVILDKWDLKEGHDAVAFMEKMVTDPAIKKVAMITDKTYAEKADGRAGGVGTETQIISQEVYDNQKQDKFVAVVTQKDEQGKPYLPTYYKSRIYIDLSESEDYGENLEKLIRWIFDKPLLVKPELGPPPAFLDEKDGISLGTSASHKRAATAIRENKPYASGALDEYLSVFSKNMERFRLQEPEGEFDEAIVESIELFLPYRNEVIKTFSIISNYAPTEENIIKLHRFFESLLQYMLHPPEARRWSEWDFDNFRFIVHELFLYALAILIKHEHFELANILLTQHYYLQGPSDYGRDAMVSFTEFRQFMRSIDHRNRRLKLNRLSLRADMLKNRSKSSGYEFRYLMQADFVLFMRGEVELTDDYNRWFPETLLYLFRFHSSFEIFSRAISKKYFDKIKCLLSITEKEDLLPLFQSYQSGQRPLPKWEWDSINPVSLLNFDKLATKP